MSRTDFTTEMSKKKKKKTFYFHNPDKDQKFQGIPRNPDRILKKSLDNENRVREHTS